MSLITSTRNQQENIIAQNPASIVIIRTSKVSDGAGGWITNPPAAFYSQDIRIYSKRIRVLVIDDGGYHSIRVTKGIAKYNANIKKISATNEDRFIHNNKNYRVFDVKDITCKGSVVFKELELEEI